ncbi:hypothetical protein KI372_07785, partial [Halobacterium salinarum]|nr:hypothetical protein [Halobacterium salinarum]
MFDKLGLSGVFGLVLMVVGVAVIAWKAPVVAAGLTAVLVGLALVARGAIQSVMGVFGEAQAVFMDEDPEVDDVTDFFDTDDI